MPHLLAAITGTAAVLRAGGEAFETIKVLGGVYLLYMAWATRRDDSALVTDPSRQRSAGLVIRSAVLANLLNPKLTIFFFAFLPQFVPPGVHDKSLRLLQFGGVFMAMTFVVFVIYGIVAALVRRHLIDRPRIIRRIRRLFAVSFVGLGVKLATTRR